MKVNYIVLNNSIVLNFGGKTLSLNKGDGRYYDVIECIKTGRLDDIPSVVDIESYFTKRGMQLTNGVLHINGEALPESLSARVQALRAASLPFDALIKFWENLRKNPSFNSRAQLFKFLEHNGHPLTEDGCFIAYRGVTEDFKDKHSGTFDNSVGSVCEMPREQVDDNPNNTCSSGLHVACFDYAKGFGPQLIEVKVNPKDVVAVPTDYNGTKMRVSRFEVVAVGEKLREEPLYGAPQDEIELDFEDDDTNYEPSYDDDDEYYDDGDL